MAVKIRLKRFGKIRAPFYRVVVMDSRTKRDGAVIEEIGKYHPTENPSVIEIDSERAQYWLGVGAQPTEQVAALLKITGDWQKFKGLDGAEGTLKVKDAKQSKLELFNEALKDAANEPKGAAVTKKSAKKTEDKAAAADKSEEKPAEEKVEEPAEVPADETPEGAADNAERLRTSPPRTRARASRERHAGRGARAPRPRDRRPPRRDVVVRDKRVRGGSLLEVRVHPDDLGKVIGRSRPHRHGVPHRDERSRRPWRHPRRLRRHRPPPLIAALLIGRHPSRVAPDRHVRRRCPAPIP